MCCKRSPNDPLWNKFYLITKTLTQTRTYKRLEFFSRYFYVHQNFYTSTFFFCFFFNVRHQGGYLRLTALSFTKKRLMVDSGRSTHQCPCVRKQPLYPLTSLQCAGFIYLCVHTLLSPATNAMDCYLSAICSWFTKKDCQGLSVSLRYAQIRASGSLFKHLGPGALERPPSFFATKRNRNWKSERRLLPPRRERVWKAMNTSVHTCGG